MAGHRRLGKTLIAPLNSFPMQDAGWLSRMVPEFLWIHLLCQDYGAKESARLSLALARCARAVPMAQGALRSCAFASAFDGFSAEDWERIVGGLSPDDNASLSASLGPLVKLSREFPLAPLVRQQDVPVGCANRLRFALIPLYDRHGAQATMLQAHVLYLLFDSRQLSFETGSVLGRFPEVQDYPLTEGSRVVASAVRASLSSCFGALTNGVSLTWPGAFWDAAWEAGTCVS